MSQYCSDCGSSYTDCSCDCDYSGSNFLTATSCDSGDDKKICCTKFTAMVLPVNNLVSSKAGVVTFFIRKKAGVITLSWETFSGQISGNGVDRIVVNQTIPYMPIFAQEFPIRIQYSGTWKTSYVLVQRDNDNSTKGQIYFYLDISGNGISENNDTFIISGNTIQWIA